MKPNTNINQFNPAKILSHRVILNKLAKGKKIYPVTCELDPSNLCNHNCIWCMYANFKKEKPKLMPRKIMFNLIRELGQMHVKSIIFTGGGEPLMNPATLGAIRYAKELKMEVGLVTNGGLMTEGCCREIIKNCTFVRISLDATDRRSHASLHRPKDLSQDNFDKIIENLKYLVRLRKDKKSPTIGIAFLVHPLNYSQIYQATKLAKDVGVDYIQIRPVYIPGKKILERMMPKIEGLVLKSLKLSDKNFSVIPMLHRFDEMSAFERNYSSCVAHNLIAAVGADCLVYLCCQLKGDPRFSFGSLKEKSFSQIWNSQKREKIINRINLHKCPPCRLNKYNELIHFLGQKEALHKNFL
ncbi:MAG: radical SAM protein [Candidatus Omnitrophota bacterium]